MQDDFVLVHASVEGFDNNRHAKNNRKSVFRRASGNQRTFSAGDSDDDRRAVDRIGDDAFADKYKGVILAKPNCAGRIFKR